MISFVSHVTLRQSPSCKAMNVKTHSLDRLVLEDSSSSVAVARLGILLCLMFAGLFLLIPIVGVLEIIEGQPAALDEILLGFVVALVCLAASLICYLLSPQSIACFERKNGTLQIKRSRWFHQKVLEYSLNEIIDVNVIVIKEKNNIITYKGQVVLTLNNSQEIQLSIFSFWLKQANKIQKLIKQFLNL